MFFFLMLLFKSVYEKNHIYIYIYIIHIILNLKIFNIYIKINNIKILF